MSGADDGPDGKPAGPRGPGHVRAGGAGRRGQQGRRRGDRRGVRRGRGRRVLGARDTAALEAVASRIRSRGGRALAAYLDVTDAGSMRQLVEQALSTFGRLDAAFNNASAGPLPTPLADIDPAEFDLGIATNIRGTFLGMKFQIPAMLRSGGGAIVNMASIAGLNGTANLAAYVAGKAGIIGLTKSPRWTTRTRASGSTWWPRARS